MYPNNFYVPFNTAYQAPMMGSSLYNMPRMASSGGGLFSRLGRSISSINWSGLLNNTSKTLGVINQAIPIVKQTGPMLHNMRSMLRVAKVFRDETSTNNNTVNNGNNTNNTNSNNINNYQEKKQDINNDNTLPNFFV